MFTFLIQMKLEKSNYFCSQTICNQNNLNLKHYHKIILKKTPESIKNFKFNIRICNSFF